MILSDGYDWRAVAKAARENDAAIALLAERRDNGQDAPEEPPWLADVTPPDLDETEPTPAQPADQVPPMGNPAPATCATWSMGDLIRAQFPEPRWIVPGLLPTGLALLSGRPKLGKLFMALQLAVAVGSGGRFLGRPVVQGGVLYVGLEDSPRRIQQRLAKMHTTGDSEVTFAFAWPPLNGAGLAKLREHVKEHAPRLVAIDTLVRGMAGRLDWNDIGQTTAVLGQLQRLAMESDMTILLVDHQKKPSVLQSDLVDDCLGSTGKAAVADSILALYRRRGEKGATLKATGRDLDECSLALEFDGVTCCWQEGEPGGVAPDSVQAMILAALADIGPLTVTSLAVQLERPSANIARELGELVAKGRVRKGAGKYAPYELLSHD